MAIDVFGVERFQTTHSHDHRHRLERRTCSLDAGLATAHGEARARIINISAGGIGFTADPVLGLRPGERITVRHANLGELRCTVRWALHPRYGAEFEQAARESGAMRRFYDSLSPGPEKTG